MPIQPFLPGLAGGGGAGGHRLGRAHGIIEISTAAAERAVVKIRRVGQQMSDAFKPVGQTIQGVQRDIASMKQELTGISVGAGLLTGFGLKAARDVRNYRIRFRELTGDFESADELMEDLKEQANLFGIELTEVYQMGATLLPVLEGGTAELDEWVKRAALLQTLNPMKNTRDAIRAIQEYLAGQERSLQYLFNIPPEAIQEAKAQFTDAGDQLDYLFEIGRAHV